MKFGCLLSLFILVQGCGPRGFTGFFSSSSDRSSFKSENINQEPVPNKDQEDISKAGKGITFGNGQTTAIDKDGNEVILYLTVEKTADNTLKCRVSNGENSPKLTDSNISWSITHNGVTIDASNYQIKELSDGQWNIEIRFINQDYHEHLSNLEVTALLLVQNFDDQLKVSTTDISEEKDEVRSVESEGSSESDDTSTPDPEPALPSEPAVLQTQLNCGSIGSPGTWVLVPGDPNYGTSDFCVMKFEAKCSLFDGSTCSANASSDAPISMSNNTPWVFINQLDAISKCSSLGDGYRLITNAEWMTIGSNLANVSSNWEGGIVGINDLTRGHSDNDPSMMCEAFTDDAFAYVQGSCAPSSTGAFNQRRTHTLSNGSVIWDLSGNAWEWTSYYNNDDKPIGENWDFVRTVTGSATMPLTDLIPQAAIDNNWLISGSYFLGDDGGALARGNRWGDNLASGVFAASLMGAPTSENNSFGFRCTYSVPALD